MLVEDIIYFGSKIGVLCEDFVWICIFILKLVIHILHLYSQLGDLPEVCSTLGVLWDSLTTKELGEVASGRDLRNMSLRKRMLPKILFRFAPPTQKHIACNLHIRFKDEPPEYANSLEGYFWG